MSIALWIFGPIVILLLLAMIALGAIAILKPER